MHHLMKSASTEFSDSDLPRRKVIPMVIGSPSESVKSELSLWDFSSGNRAPVRSRTPPPPLLFFHLPYRFSEDLSLDIAANLSVTGSYRPFGPVNASLSLRGVNDSNFSSCGFCQFGVIPVSFLRLAPRSCFSS